MISEICKNPFRLFFPVAMLCLFYGCSLWILFGLFEYGEFPIERHANLFVGGFLYFSILGFLLTAIPRFTSSNFLSTPELLIFILIMLVTIVFYALERETYFWSSITCGWFTLFYFGIKRFRKRKQNPPFTFLFVGLGLIFGFMGSVFNLLSSYNFEIFGNLETWGKLFFYDAMVTSFILGVGGRLIPGILGFVEIVKNQRQIYESSHSFFKVIPVGIYISLFTFIMSFLLEGAGLLNTGYLSRAVVITYFSFRYWRLHEKVKTEKWHGRILKVSCFFLLIATWLLCFFKDYIIDIKHLIYIGSYCLMTLMVASRVVLAHGKAGLGFEHRTFPYLLIGGLVSLAALTRATAQFVSDSYFEHLGYTGLILLLAVLVWLTSFLCKIILHK